MRRRSIVALIAVGTLSLLAATAQAGTLQYISDLISTSAPGSTASHIIQFTLAADVPPSGTITITPEFDGFELPSGFDHTDMEFSYATSGPYFDRPIASVADSSDDGISVVTGSSSALTITLNSSTGLFAGDKVRVSLVSSTTPLSAYPLNPTGTGSYRIRIQTYDQSNAPIDHGTTMIAIVDPVSVGPFGVVQHAPTLTNGLPSGTVAANNPNIEISIDSDELSTCRYSTTSGVAYASMTGQFLPNIGTSFYADLTGFQNNTSYTYYVRCLSTQGIADTVDYPITFTLDPTPVSNTSVASGDQVSSGSGGVGNFPNGSAVLYLGSVTFTGITVPNGIVTVLKDGAQKATAQAQADGTFKVQIAGLERGLYSFMLYATDSGGNVTGSDSETMTVTSASANTISGIDIPPSMQFASTSIAAGSSLPISGQSAPGSTVTVSLTGASGSATTYTASTTSDGSWSVTVPSSALSKGAYLVKAQATEADQSTSNFTGPVSIQVGTVATSCSKNNADLNGDGKVNLIDFSIMLTQWGGPGKADLNCDGTVGLADFSILLFHWTG